MNHANKTEPKQLIMKLYTFIKSCFDKFTSVEGETTLIESFNNGRPKKTIATQIDIESTCL